MRIVTKMIAKPQLPTQLSTVESSQNNGCASGVVMP